MKDGYKVLLGTLACIVLTLSLVVAVLQAPIEAIEKIEENRGHSLSIQAHLICEVYREGKLIKTYEKKGDLILKNLASLLTALLCPTTTVKAYASGESNAYYSYVYYAQGSELMTRMDGTTIYAPSHTRNPKIHLGNGTVKYYDINNYTLVNEIASITPQQPGELIVSGNNLTIHIFGSWVAPEPVNITEIGLSFEIYAQWRAGSYAYAKSLGRFLVLYDVVNISLQTNDEIVVHYKIEIIQS